MHKPQTQALPTVQLTIQQPKDKPPRLRLQYIMMFVCVCVYVFYDDEPSSAHGNVRSIHNNDGGDAFRRYDYVRH